LIDPSGMSSATETGVSSDQRGKLTNIRPSGATVTPGHLMVERRDRLKPAVATFNQGSGKSLKFGLDILCRGLRMNGGRNGQQDCHTGAEQEQDVTHDGVLSRKI
jgi:hypothetical protein